MQGMPPRTLDRMSSIIVLLDSSSSQWSSGYPPERTIPSTSGRTGSRIGENLTISAPHLSRSSTLSSYVKQNVSSSARPILTSPFILLTAGASYRRSGAWEAILTSRSMSRVPSRTSASLLSLSFSSSISEGSTRPRCLLSSTRSETLGTYPMGSTPISLAAGAMVSYTLWDMLLKITPLMLLGLNSRNPFSIGSTDMLAPLQLRSRTTGMSSLCETSYELASELRMLMPS